MLKLNFTDGSKIETYFETIKEVNKVYDEYQVLTWDSHTNLLHLYNGVKEYAEE